MSYKYQLGGKLITQFNKTNNHPLALNQSTELFSLWK